MHIGAVMIFEGPPPAHDEFLGTIESRLHLVPRYRQKLAFPRFEMGRPLWIDDPTLQHRLPRAPLGAAEPGLARAAAADGRAGVLAAARPLQAAVGDLGGGGARGRALRPDQQDPPLPGGRRLRGGHHDRAVRPRARAGRGAAAGARVVAGAGALGRRHRGRGHPRPGARRRCGLAGRALAAASAPRRTLGRGARGRRGRGRGGSGASSTARPRPRSTSRSARTGAWPGRAWSWPS